MNTESFQMVVMRDEDENAIGAKFIFGNGGTENGDPNNATPKGNSITLYFNTPVDPDNFFNLPEDPLYSHF